MSSSAKCIETKLITIVIDIELQPIRWIDDKAAQLYVDSFASNHHNSFVLCN